MIKLPTHLDNDNILPLISLFYEETKDYIKTYEALIKHIIILDTKGSSLLLTFPTLILYQLIKNNAPLEEFDLLLNHLENTLVLKRTFKTFFNQDTDITIKDYKLAKKNNTNNINYKIWDELSLVFLDYSETKKAHLHVEKKPYLHSLLNKVTSENCDLKDFLLLYYFPILLINNSKDIADILENHPDIAHKFIISISEMDSNKMSNSDRKDIITTFKKYIPDFDKYFYNLVFHSYSENVQTFPLNTYLNLMKIIGEKEFIFKLTEHIQNFLSPSNPVTKKYDRVLKLCLNLKKILKETHISLDENIININKKFMDNCIPIIILESQVEQSNDVIISVKTAKYLIKEINTIEQNDNLNFPIQFNFGLLNDYAQYILLEKKLPNKDNKANKNKKKI